MAKSKYEGGTRPSRRYARTHWCPKSSISAMCGMERPSVATVDPERITCEECRDVYISLVAPKIEETL